MYYVSARNAEELAAESMTNEEEHVLSALPLFCSVSPRKPPKQDPPSHSTPKDSSRSPSLLTLSR